ncbi:YvrJ family protein [Paenibacillus alkalitolerans]|uniref:YvrJ family protein n=1 Tax=Paenibacillus alkalitolerans TaxID=2799335 RepID=UPI001F2318A9|nr:YvrJ family protein [Paenibacillus alkalitolerans]
MMNNQGEWIAAFSAAIGNYGFPIAVAVYLLISFQRKIDDLTQSVNELRQQIKDEGRSR